LVSAAWLFDSPKLCAGLACPSRVNSPTRGRGRWHGRGSFRRAEQGSGGWKQSGLKIRGIFGWLARPVHGLAGAAGHNWTGEYAERGCGRTGSARSPARKVRGMCEIFLCADCASERFFSMLASTRAGARSHGAYTLVMLYAPLCSASIHVCVCLWIK